MLRPHGRHAVFTIAGLRVCPYLPFQSCTIRGQCAAFFIKDTPMPTTTMTPVFATRASDSMLQRLWRTLRARYVANRTRAALSTLTPRELEDVGLTSADIDRVARRVAGL